MKKVTFDIEKFFKSTFVVSLTSSEVGAYLLLLFISAENEGYLPNDMEYIRKVTRLPNNAWLKSKDKLLSKFTLTDKGYCNDTMMKKVESAVIISKKRKQNGGIRKPKNEKHGISTQNAEINIDQQNQQKSIANTKQVLSTSLVNTQKTAPNLDGTNAHKIAEERAQGKWHRIQDFIEKDPDDGLMAIKKIPNQLTYRQCCNLVGELNDSKDLGTPFTTKLVKEKLFKMADSEGIEKKNYIYHTLLSWCQNETKGKTYAKVK